MTTANGECQCGRTPKDADFKCCDWCKVVELNKNKHLIKAGDMAVSEVLGLGKVTEVLYDEDVWNPIQVVFSPVCSCGCGDRSDVTEWCDASGGSSNGKYGRVKFYKEIL